jgi:hypothetical protein
VFWAKIEKNNKIVLHPSPLTQFVDHAIFLLSYYTSDGSKEEFHFGLTGFQMGPCNAWFNVVLKRKFGDGDHNQLCILIQLI